MGKEPIRLSGGCMCGAVRYETTHVSERVIHCHCQSCRKHTGAPSAALAVYKVGEVSFSGVERKPYQSAPGVVRAFCPECGTPLTWETDLPGTGPVCSLHISTFDDPEVLKPFAHSFYGERISWFDVADDLPRYETFVLEDKLICHGPASR